MGKVHVHTCTVYEATFIYSQRHSPDASLYHPPQSTTITTVSCLQRPAFLKHPQVSLKFGYLLLVMICLAPSVQLQSPKMRQDTTR